MTPILQSLQKIYSQFVVAVPDALFPLYLEQKIFSRMIPSKEIEFFEKKHQPSVLDLSFPLLQGKPLPSHHFRLKKDYFFKAQHVFKSYIEALKEFFPQLSSTVRAEPFLKMDFVDNKIFSDLQVKPFFYFTVHSGSDFPAKNWDLKNFEEIVTKILQRYSSLQCLSIQGPVDLPLFENNLMPERFKVVKSDLKTVSQILGNSLFHIDNDSGIHHLAGAADVPSITIFGATGPGSWASLTERNFIHWGGPNCSTPCRGERLQECADRVCLSSVKADHLVPSVEKILSAYRHL